MDAGTGALQHIEHILKALRTAVVGIGHLGGLSGFAPALREKRAQQPDMGLRPAGKVLLIPQVVAVHGHDEVELVQIFGLSLIRSCKAA